MKALPLDLSSFPEIMERDFLYVDKTEEIYRLLQDKGKYYFLARPRRFGKSLLISTLEALFLGKQELFKGLFIYDKIDWVKWGSFPVIRINFSQISNSGTAQDFELSIIKNLHFNYALKYGIDIDVKGNKLKDYVYELIIRLHYKTNKRIVLLIDEYDKPITDHISNLTQAQQNQEVLRDFYDLIENSTELLEFVFITGISKLARLSVFSVMNNLRDISERPAFNNIVGFTHQDLTTYFDAHIQAFADKEQTTSTAILQKLKYWYDGYSWNGVDRLYNPFSLVNALYDLMIDFYWYSTGTPQALVHFVQQQQFSTPAELKQKIETDLMEPITTVFFKSNLLSKLSIKNMLYQTGYLTIKSVEKVGFQSLYYLKHPNYEVAWSFSAYLLHLFYQFPEQTIYPSAVQLKNALQMGDTDQAMRYIRHFLAQIPYELRKNTDEAYYHSLFQLLFTLIGVEMESERSAPKGRMDGFLVFPNRIYIIEFKFSRKGSMKALLNSALRQIKKKQYGAIVEAHEQQIIYWAVGFLEKEGVQEGVMELEIEGQIG